MLLNHSFIGGLFLNQRMTAIADAAALLFLRQGYAKTQISHIAKAAGVSVGTIYLDFAGKREILHFVLKRTMDPDFIHQDFQRPITDALFRDIEQEILSFFQRMDADFASHLENGAADYSFEALISDTFDRLARYAVGCLFIEKNYFDFPRLDQCYRASRTKFFNTMTRYLSLFAERGEIRPLEHPDLSAALIIELLSWWAMDVHYTAFEPRDIPPELAKHICLEHLQAAYRP